MIHVITGAFGFTGKYIAKRLLKEKCEVRTLTNSINRENPFGESIKIYPFNFDDPQKLEESLRGASVLYNTYWVRFNHKDFKHSIAVENTLKLFHAAKNAGVKHIVHISITNASEVSDLEYFRGKGKLENALIQSGMSYSILRPAVLFGYEDILINNISWMLRKFPFFCVFGDGNYRLQPIYVDDLAKLAIEEGKKHLQSAPGLSENYNKSLNEGNNIIDAIGPETFTYRELVNEIGKIIGKRRPIISIPNSIGYLLGWIVGKIVGDVLITREEIKGLTMNLLYTNSPPAGNTKLTEWAKKYHLTLGKHYASELARRKNRTKSYDDL